EEYSHDSFLSTLGFSAKKECQYADEMDPLEMIEGEEEVFGFYISGHPVKIMHRDMQYSPFTLLHHNNRNGDYLHFYEKVKVSSTRRRQNLAVVSVSDGCLEMTPLTFPKVSSNTRAMRSEKSLVTCGTIEERKEQKQINIDDIPSPEILEKEYLKS